LNIKYKDILKANKWLELVIEHEERKSLKIKGNDVPWSITEEEFEFIYNVIKDRKLKRGFEVGTAFGISALAAGLALKRNEGRLVSMDCWEENPACFNFSKRLIKQYKLEKIICLKTGSSPQDSIPRVNEEFEENELLDYVFIDATHNDTAVLIDFKAIEEKLDKKAIVLFHDGFGGEIGAQAIPQLKDPHGFRMMMLEIEK